MLINLCETNNVEYNIAIPHNIIGPKQRYDDPFRNVVSIMTNLILQNRRPIIYGDGEQKRSFSDIDDVLDVGKGDEHNGETFVLSLIEDGFTMNG